MSRRFTDSRVWSTLNITLVIAVLGLIAMMFTGCATTSEPEAFKRDVIYTANFQCIPADTPVDEVANAIKADCERYDKEALFGPPPMVVPCGANKVQVRVTYKCAEKESDVK